MKEQNLSPNELKLMKMLWKVGEDLTINEIVKRYREESGYDYARTTITTFLLKMENKGYISTYRKGKYTFIHAEQSEDEYRKEIVAYDTDYWFDGKAPAFIAALCSSRKLSKEEIREIKELLDGLDD